MSVTVINRPLGHKLNITDVSATIIDSGTDQAVVYTGTAHGLSDGDYIYIESNFDAYNGFKYVDSISYDTFKIKESIGGDYTEFKQEADISFRVSVEEHGWQCVHLPIVYELYNDLFPVNYLEESYVNIVVSFAGNANGYTALTGSTDFININALDYIEFIGTGPLAGIYRILDKTDSDDIIIDLLWNSSNVWSGYELRKYYNNYFVTVRVYGGLTDTHYWVDEKPFELLAEEKFIPDSNNIVKFSISEILKGQILTRNNLTLDTLPNNLDFFTQFYITYFESYDTSNGTEISVATFPIVDDSTNFIGNAVNAMLPFKSLHMGHMSDYIFAEGYPARWLILQDRPIAFVDRFLDMSFINSFDGDIIVRVKKTLTESNYTSIEDTTLVSDIGVIRFPITPEEGYNEYCISVLTSSFSDYLNNFRNYNLYDEPSPNMWTLGSTPTNTIGALEATVLLYGWIDFLGNSIVTLNYSIDVDDDSNLFVVLLNDSMTVIAEYGDYAMVTGINSGSVIIDYVSGVKYVGIIISDSSDFGNTFTVLSLEVTGEESQIIVEEICIDIISECSSTFINDDLRLTEGGIFRELE